MKKYYLLTLITFGILFSTYSVGQSESPERLAKKYFNAMENEGMNSVARFMHPDALVQFKSMLLPVFEYESESGSRHLMDITFGSLTSFETVGKMEPEEFMNGFMNIVVAQLGSSKLSFDKLEILGTIDEGEDRHVLTRMTIGVEELAFTQFEVLSFKPYENSWRLQLNGQMKGLANQLRARLPK